MQWIVVIIIMCICTYCYMQIENSKAKKRQEQIDLLNELLSTYSKLSDSQLIKEYNKILPKYDELLGTAHQVYIKSYDEKTLYNIYGEDQSEGIMKEMNYLLYSKHYALEDSLQKRNLFNATYEVDENSTKTRENTKYIVIGSLKYKDEYNKSHKLKYTAKVSLNYDNSERICFTYSKNVAMKIPQIGKIAFIRYDFMKKIIQEDDGIVFEINASKYMNNYIKKYLSCNAKIQDNYIIFKLETDNPEALYKEIKKRMKKI